MNKPLKNLEIIGDCIRLRPFTELDISNIFISWLNDKEVVKYSNQRLIRHTHNTCLDYLNNFSSTSNIYLAIENKETKELYGTMTGYVSIHHNTADIGLMVGNKKSWGLGIGCEAWALLMNYLFSYCKIRKVTGGTLRENFSMVRIMEKNGMIPDGVKIKQELVDGTPVDILYFCKFAND
jgi:[ribosomal protein S5]-alanine N-acetyltransferase